VIRAVLKAIVFKGSKLKLKRYVSIGDKATLDMGEAWARSSQSVIKNAIDFGELNKRKTQRGRRDCPNYISPFKASLALDTASEGTVFRTSPSSV